MKGRYAIIGWGSLIWDLEILTPHVELPWRMDAGPSLPMEFSRISAKRKMGLAVCLDLVSGTPCPTHVVPSTRDTLVDAVTDLAARERAPFERIGGVCVHTDASQGRPQFRNLIREWCLQNNWQGAVWTDLGSNFRELRSLTFSVTTAITYLQGLKGEGLDEAIRYIVSAPEATDTPLRRALAQNDWWRDQVQQRGYALPEIAIT